MSDRLLVRIADRVINRPLMVMPEKLAIITQVLEGRLSLNAGDLKAEMPASKGRVEASQFVGQYEPIDPANPRGAKKPYRTTKGGTAIIPVLGSLVNRGYWIEALSGITSYEQLKSDVSMAASDPAVKSILMDIDSPGGEAVGAFEAADVIRAASVQKPVIAVANGLCCSAAYAVASAATKIVASSSSLIGSIGVVMLHVDHSEKLAKEGVRPTLLHVGARKIDGNPYSALNEASTSSLEAELESFMDLFVQGVIAGRPHLTEIHIRNLEAAIFVGRKAVEAGLADDVGSLEAALDELEGRKAVARRPRTRSAAAVTQKENSMSEVQAERDRVSAIFALPEVKGREAAAAALVSTGASVDMARQMLACLDIPSAAAVKPRASLIERMEGPQAGADAVPPEYSVQPAGSSLADRMRARHGIT